MEPIEFRQTRAHLTPTTVHGWSVYIPATRWKRILEDIRTGGRDPIFRRNMTLSITLHFLIIFGPYLLGLFSGVTDYRVPKGSGVADPAGMQVQKPVEVKIKTKKQKPRRKFVFRSNSAILFHAPDIMDSQVLRDVIKESEQTYESKGATAQEIVAQATNESAGGMVKGGTGKSAGKLGRGGGKRGGYPDGAENALVRFIRLEHGGPGWDDGMQPNRASDINFLKQFHDATGFKVATKPESHAIGKITGYTKGFAPPFFYITGTGAINASSNDIKILREYLLGGGMLFADCGAPAFDTSFQALMRQVFPDKSMVTIADDDIIFREPFQLPNGAPPIYHHAGMKAKGIKHRDRWCVFYHPGDLKDAFRIGNSGLAKNVVEEAYHLGANIIDYAFSHYLEATRQDRK